MTQTGPFASRRVDDDLISRAVGRLRRRDVRVWAGAPHWIENSGPDGAGRLVRWRNSNVVAASEGAAMLGSGLYGYGAPAWAPVTEDRAVALTTRPLGVLSVGADGHEGLWSPLLAESAGYVCPVADSVVVVVDRGNGRGRAIVRGTPGNEFSTVYETDNLVSDLVIAPDGDHAAWIEWPVGTMPWDAASLRVASVEQPLVWLVTTVELNGTCAQPVFVSDALVVDIEVGEWFHPHRVVDGTATAVDLPEADYRPDWSLGHTWVAHTTDAILWCAVRDSRSRQWFARGDAVVELTGGPAYLYDVCRDGDGFIALGSSTVERGALWRVASGEDRWHPLAESHEHRWSGRPELRRTTGGIPYLWYWPDADDHFVPTDRPGLVVVVHGGPTKYASYEFSWVIELICRSGFAVASVDHRGSTSYGRSFRDALTGHWGEYDVTDVAAVLQDVVASGDVDPDRVVVRGTSAGALSALLVASVVPVTGVVVVSPVTDPLALFWSTHDFDCEYARQLTGGVERALARSPLHAVDAMPALVLVIHGTRDDIVPVEQTRSFVAALRSRGRVVTYLELEGEGHSFRRAESGRLAHRAEADFYSSLEQS